MTGGSIETTLELWASSPGEVKGCMRGLMFGDTLQLRRTEFWTGFWVTRVVSARTAPGFMIGRIANSLILTSTNMMQIH